MKRSALGYNVYVNPFSSHAADVFHHFAYIISATIVLYTNLACREVLLVCMATEQNCFVNHYCSHVLIDNLYPNIAYIITSFIMQSIASSTCIIMLLHVIRTVQVL